LKDGYKLMGSTFELMATLYALGQNKKCKASMLDHLKKGDKLLIAGVGHGTEAIAACKQGIEVTAVDLSKTMIKQIQKKLNRAGLENQIQIINDDILNIDHHENYDMVIANFFLNVFAEEKMLQILNHMATLVKPGRYLTIGDFAIPKNSGRAFKIFQTIYWYIAATLYWATADNAIHPIYDYPELLKSIGFNIESIRYYKVLNMKCYWSVLGKKRR
jgi:demethylmenaquinone methyltransferase/2-methoxy-6-polyprenyl-1,4-benzoquinol methylase